MTLPALVRTVLEPAPGERLVVDHLAGASPPFVFLHGLGSVRTGEKSNALLHHAGARGRAAVRFDFRGHGESSGQLGHVTFSELVADAVTVLDRLGPAVLFGSSLGGLVAAHVAAARPDAVLGLAMLSPAFGFLPHMPRLVAAHGCVVTSEGVSFPVHERVLEDAARHDEDVLPRRLSMPVFAAHGTDDAIVPAALTAAFVAAIPHDRKDCWIVPGGDHRLSRDIDAILARMQRLFDAHGTR